MVSYIPDKVYVERCVADSWITRNVLRRLPAAPVEWLEDSRTLLSASRRSSPSLAAAKRSLVLARHKGRFFKDCPASRSRGERNVCCNYFVVNYASNCHMECSYCYLQTHLNFPHLVVYANYPDLLQELAARFESHPSTPFRVGTGELADSLALDSLTRYSVPLVEFFARYDNAILEFKTKSDCVENLMGLDHGGRTVVSWSINPRAVQESDEHRTASIERRLRAAERCVAGGYRVGFHLDPMIHYPGWQEDYEDLVDEIFRRLPPRSVAWISLGSLRLSAGLKAFMRSRFPRSGLPLGELVPVPDGKLRYFWPIRVRMYRSAVEWVRTRSPGTPVYLCMERPGVWSKVFAQAPPDEKRLGRRLAGSLAVTAAR